jgi:predicted NAD/FAD-dependent oxidoreductase
MKKSGPVAIIGAGLSGLSCAQSLRAAGINVRVFESGPVVGGRCATRLWQGHLVDTGIQYFTAQSTEFKRELLTRIRQFRPIISPILDQDNKVVVNSTGPRFYVLQGNNYFAHVLSQGLDIRLNTRVETVSFNSDGVECLGEPFSAVVSAIPGPLAARLLNLARAPVEYDPCIVALLEYSDNNHSRECYGRVQPESGEPLVSSHCENNKVGRIIGDKTVFVAQASPAFSREHAKAPPESYLPKLISAHEKMWKLPAGQCTASSVQCWLHARPQEGNRHRVDLPHGAFICGDSRTDSSVEQVWMDGRKAAGEVISFLAANLA